ncbi:MAG TPA: flavin reductase family protein, partial [Mycobacterium sp.]|nr:flavin reductase family protein [Mycobacterium sp.]
MTVVTTPEGTHARGMTAGSLMHGMTASSFAAVSLDPRLLAVSVNKPGGSNNRLHYLDRRGRPKVRIHGRPRS